MKRVIILMLLLSVTAFAGKIGLAVQFNSSAAITKCIEFQNSSSAFDILQESNLGIATKDYGPGLGVALCKIGEIGCGADNCFCDSSYWSFYYLAKGKWAYSDTGISSYTVKDGDVLGFRWGAYGDEPELHSLGEICPSTTVGGGEQIRYFSVSTDGNCTEEPFSISVTERGGGVVWEPTLVSLDSQQDFEAEYGVEVKVLLYQTYFGRDAGFENIAVLFTDKGGNASFIPEKAGRYKLKFEKDGFLIEEKDVEINECQQEVQVVSSSEIINNSGEGVTPPVNTEPNTTRIDIIAPKTAVVNSTVTIMVVTDKGDAVAYGEIFVEFPGGIKELITNKSGEATFNATIEGVYSYSPRDYVLGSSSMTNVSKGIEIPLKSPVIIKEEQPPSVGMATAVVSPEALGAGVLIVIVLVYLLQRVIE